jgi:hypothetical protein
MANGNIHVGNRAFGLNLASREIAGLREAHVNPVLRIGVADNCGELNIQDFATWQRNDRRGARGAALPELLA